MEIETKPMRAFARRVFSARLGAVLMLAHAALFSACGGVNPTEEIGASAETATEPLLADPDCSVIEAQLVVAERRIDQILEALQTTPPGSEHNELLRQLRLWTSRAAQLRRSLDRCRNPPPPPPPPPPVQCTGDSTCCAPVTGGCASADQCIPPGHICP